MLGSFPLYLPPPHLHGAVCGAGVDQSVKSHHQGVNGVVVSGYGFQAFEVGGSPDLEAYSFWFFHTRMFLLSDPVYNKSLDAAKEYIWPSSRMSDPTRTADTDSSSVVVVFPIAYARGWCIDSEKQKARLEVEHRSSQWEENKECASATTVGPVSKQLYLKSCSKASSQGLDKQLVLRRIRHLFSSSEFHEKTALKLNICAKGKDTKLNSFVEAIFACALGVFTCFPHIHIAFTNNYAS
ncbi:uncharacterized protein G2W53_019943 [Senna tora]|uniref:Uncharacterized protein n=1 Tax=Senna tora TaxID=362788 RepID=A0A834U2Q3_9FABA|nr:uncharacterized protein G2W53_019943 [Senna tora]